MAGYQASRFPNRRATVIGYRNGRTATRARRIVPFDRVGASAAHDPKRDEEEGQDREDPEPDEDDRRRHRREDRCGLAERRRIGVEEVLRLEARAGHDGRVVGRRSRRDAPPGLEDEFQVEAQFAVPLEGGAEHEHAGPADGGDHEPHERLEAPVGERGEDRPTGAGGHEGHRTRVWRVQTRC